MVVGKSGNAGTGITCNQSDRDACKISKDGARAGPAAVIMLGMERSSASCCQTIVTLAWAS